MNQVHIHLLINHLPVFGSFLGALVLFYGIWLKSNTTKNAAYLVFIISAFGAVIAYKTSEAAEEAVKHLSGVSESLIHEHEEAAEFAFYFMIVLGVASLIGIWITIKNKKINRLASWIILLLSVFCFTVVARTTFLGGKIRHTEEISGTPNSSAIESAEDDD